MTPEAWTFLAAAVVIAALFIIRDRGALQQVRYLRKQRDRLADVTTILTAELIAADGLAVKQARRSNEQKARIAELEADVSVSRAAAHGSAWGPTL